MDHSLLDDELNEIEMKSSRSNSAASKKSEDICSDDLFTSNNNKPLVVNIVTHPSHELDQDHIATHRDKIYATTDQQDENLWEEGYDEMSQTEECQVID